PCIGTVTCPLPAIVLALWLPAARRGRAGPGAVLVPGFPAATGAVSGTHRTTEYRRPLTSTSTSRRTLPAPAAPPPAPSPAAPAPAPTAVPASRWDRSSRSSTHFVECVAAAKSGCERMATWAAFVVATPST